MKKQRIKIDEAQTELFNEKGEAIFPYEQISINLSTTRNTLHKNLSKELWPVQLSFITEQWELISPQETLENNPAIIQRKAELAIELQKKQEEEKRKSEAEKVEFLTTTPIIFYPSGTIDPLCTKETFSLREVITFYTSILETSKHNYLHSKIFKTWTVSKKSSISFLEQLRNFLKSSYNRNGEQQQLKEYLTFTQDIYQELVRRKAINIDNSLNIQNLLYWEKADTLLDKIFKQQSPYNHPKIQQLFDTHFEKIKKTEEIDEFKSKIPNILDLFESIKFYMLQGKLPLETLGEDRRKAYTTLLEEIKKAKKRIPIEYTILYPEPESENISQEEYEYYKIPIDWDYKLAEDVKGFEKIQENHLPPEKTQEEIGQEELDYYWTSLDLQQVKKEENELTDKMRKNLIQDQERDVEEMSQEEFDYYYWIPIDWDHKLAEDQKLLKILQEDNEEHFQEYEEDNFNSDYDLEKRSAEEISKNKYISKEVYAIVENIAQQHSMNPTIEEMDMFLFTRLLASFLQTRNSDNYEKNFLSILKKDIIKDQLRIKKWEDLLHYTRRESLTSKEKTQRKSEFKKCIAKFSQVEYKKGELIHKKTRKYIQVNDIRLQPANKRESSLKEEIDSIELGMFIEENDLKHLFSLKKEIIVYKNKKEKKRESFLKDPSLLLEWLKEEQNAEKDFWNTIPFCLSKDSSVIDDWLTENSFSLQERISFYISLSKKEILESREESCFQMIKTHFERTIGSSDIDYLNTHIQSKSTTKEIENERNDKNIDWEKMPFYILVEEEDMLIIDEENSEREYPLLQRIDFYLSLSNKKAKTKKEEIYEAEIKKYFEKKLFREGDTNELQYWREKLFKNPNEEQSMKEMFQEKRERTEKFTRIYSQSNKSFLANDEDDLPF